MAIGAADSDRCAGRGESDSTETDHEVPGRSMVIVASVSGVGFMQRDGALYAGAHTSSLIVSNGIVVGARGRNLLLTTHSGVQYRKQKLVDPR